MKTSRVAMLFAATVLVAGPLRAQAGGEDARAAYEAGSSEYDLGHYRKALDEFEKAFRLKHIPALLFSIAQCHRMLGEMKEAATVYRSFIAKDPQNVRVGQASALLAQVESAMDKQAEAQRARPIEVAGPTQPNPRQHSLAPVATPAQPGSAAQSGRGAPVMVVKNLYQPSAIVMDATHIYWCNNSTTQANGTGNSDGTIRMILK